MFKKLLPGHSLGKTLKSLEIAEFIITENIHMAGSKISEHSHENAHFCFVLEGSYSEFQNKRELICQPSTLTFRPSGEVHRDYFHEQDVRVFIIEIPPKWIERLRDNSIQLCRAVNFQDNVLPRLTTRLNREFHHMDNASSLIIEGLTIEIIAEAARYSLQHTEQQIPHWLKRAKDLIHARFSENLTLNQIASDVGVHPVHLASVFRQKYHSTVGEYIRQLRIEYACRKLAKENTPLVKIALDAGFANQAHFSSTFKRLTGFTPTSYRNSFHQS
jgi:AraC family transcriptional regulator